MASLNLTQTFVDEVQYDPAGKQNQLYHDDKVKGLVLQVGRQTKSWCVQHHLRPRKAFARTTEKTLKQARADAQVYIGQLGKGIDPWAISSSDPNAMTLRQLVEAQLNSPRKQEKGPRRRVTIDATWWCFETFLSDWIDKPFSRIKRKDVSERFAAIEQHRITSPKGNTVGSYSQAQSVMNYLRTAFKYAVDVLEYEGGNPTAAVSKLIAHGKGNKHRALTVDELKKLGECFAKWPAGANPRIPSLIKLMLLTGTRIRPALELQWSYLHDDRIEQPASQSKSNRIYVAPMTPQIRRELATLREIKIDETWVFPSESESGHMTHSNWAIEKVEAVCGLKITNHSLRYTFAKIGEDLKIPQQVVAMLLDHSSEFTITDRYQIDAFTKQTAPAIKRIDAKLSKLLLR